MTDIRAVVQERYGKFAASVEQPGPTSGCCGTTGCCDDPITGGLYSPEEIGAIPPEALQASLGCGNPTALIDLAPGQVVLDLGSGGGIDVLLSARRVGPTGKAYGLDMTGDMLALARRNQARAGITNAEFLEGTIEAIPLPDASVDVIISNCVINLSADKPRVLHEAFRVLKPGGRFAVSDVLVRGDVPADVRHNMGLWVGCIAGALTEDEYIGGLRAAGFEEVSVEPWREYAAADAEAYFRDAGQAVGDLTAADGRFFSGFVRARKPLAR
ncbi:arsenite S-adenosylmethyltransferase [Luteitalea sp. TBR-22]|uniref:arsenite methyltransferase n=1 Tax=Luteitalea sp. TBR-22 TaxID=2802971 RepID=UPI001AFC9C8E|nr:arsenite methyltransferase [Luteitalea sp. TBR-22]BCS32930.1 arsenite S-adenosylmethyltransferase [Luteitalea sp. TBR-22]